MPKIIALKAEGSKTLRMPLCKPRSIHWFRRARVRAKERATRIRFE